METVRMVAFRTHTRGDVLLQPGVEFDASEAESHAYLARKNPLAGPLDAIEVRPSARPVVEKVAAPAMPKPKAKPRPAAKKKK